MFVETAEAAIRQEIESVRVRRIILEQLEGGKKTGSELREAIRRDIIARQGDKEDEVKVTDPKLYFNTKHLEKKGMISSSKDGRKRVYELSPEAIHPVRKVLKFPRPSILITSIAMPDDQRPLAKWLSRDERIDVEIVRIFVSERRFSRGVQRSLSRFIPNDCDESWETTWHEIPDTLLHSTVVEGHGNLEGIYEHIEKIALQDMKKYNLIVDVSMGPAVIVLALFMLASEYSLEAVYLDRTERGKFRTFQLVPRG
jgi:DNA-binding PadR family transcriptional regulator